MNSFSSEQGVNEQGAVDLNSSDFNNPDYYLNRELSLLQFNLRVLEQAMDENHPLMERLNFLLIFSSNMDEFFEIRVAGLKNKLETHTGQPGPDGMLPDELLKEISAIPTKRWTASTASSTTCCFPPCAKKGWTFFAAKTGPKRRLNGSKIFSRADLSGAHAHRAGPVTPVPAPGQQEPELSLYRWTARMPLAVPRAWPLCPLPAPAPSDSYS